MSFFQKVRAAFGLGNGSENPIDTLDGVLLEETIAIHELNNAEAEFEEVSGELELKSMACDVLIQKGYADGPLNKKVVENKIAFIVSEFFDLKKSINEKLIDIRQRKAVLEVDIIDKSIDFTNMLSEPQQAYMHDLVTEWHETGMVDNEEIESHALAIVKSIDIISDGFFQKAVAAPVGDVRAWGNKKYQKTQDGWIPLKKNKEKIPEKKHSTQELVAHAENTSVDQLKKIASDESKSSHVRDSAKREIERRNEGKDTEKRQWAREDKLRVKDKELAEKEKKADLKIKEKDKKSTEAAKLQGDKGPMYYKNIAHLDAKGMAEKEFSSEDLDYARKFYSDEVKIKKKKKDLPVKYTPSEHLNKDHSKIEKKFGKYLNSKYKQAKTIYEAKFGNILNTDNARELSDDYEDNRSELSAAVHEPASSLVKKLYEEMLAEPAPEGKRDLVFFTAGGTGSGKTTGIAKAGLKSIADKAHIVFDTNMNTYESSVKKIEQALAAKKDVQIAYTYRNPIVAFEHGAVPRSMRMGRTVPISEHIKTHMGSLDTIIQLKDKYKDNPKVNIHVIDNSDHAGKVQLKNIQFVKDREKAYTASELRDSLHKINNKLYEQGKITESHYKGFKGAE